MMIDRNLGRLKVSRSDLIHIYDSVFCIPNGDPFTGEQRYDEATSKVLISDVRIKRYIRDFFLFLNLMDSSKEHEIYLQEVDRSLLAKEDIKGTGSEARLKILAKKYGVEIAATEDGKKSKKSPKFDVDTLLKKCIDVRCFGGISTAESNNAQFTGPIQFDNLNPSLNKCELRRHQNTTVFESSMDKDQGSIGTTSLVPYSLNQIIGYINPFLALKTDLTEEDISAFVGAMWDSINICTSRSKVGQTSRLFLKINLRNPLSKVADLQNKIKINEGDSFDLRSIRDVTWDFSGLVAVIASDRVSSVEYRVEDAVAEAFKIQTKSVASKLVELK
jgi:CRISPR-associated protein Csh2